MSLDMIDPEFPCSIILSVPLPTHRLASSALRALQVDAELSALVRRSFSLTTPDSPHAQPNIQPNRSEAIETQNEINVNGTEDANTVLVTEYKATTNRMLRVAVNGFMESLSLVLGVMEELDMDVLGEGS